MVRETTRLSKTSRKSKASKSSLFNKANLRYWQLYILMVPAIVYMVIFMYGPMYGVQIAFRDFSARAGFWNSPWVGLTHFKRFLSYPDFWRIMQNTLSISLLNLVFGFPLPILLALMLNEVRNRMFKKTVQMATYLPYFISSVAFAGMVTLFCDRNAGMITNILTLFGVERSNLLSVPGYFQAIYVGSYIWQHTGYTSVLYIASLSNVDMSIVEAARVDGASRLQKVWHVDFQCLKPTIIIQLILSIGRILTLSYDRILLLQNDLNMETSDIISTYVYRLGLIGGQFSYTTAIGLFNNVINLILLVIVNTIARKYSETSV